MLHVCAKHMPGIGLWQTGQRCNVKTLMLWSEAVLVLYLHKDHAAWMLSIKHVSHLPPAAAAVASSTSLSADMHWQVAVVSKHNNIQHSQLHVVPAYTSTSVCHPDTGVKDICGQGSLQILQLCVHFSAHWCPLQYCWNNTHPWLATFRLHTTFIDATIDMKRPVIIRTSKLKHVLVKCVVMRKAKSGRFLTHRPAG